MGNNNSRSCFALSSSLPSPLPTALPAASDQRTPLPTARDPKSCTSTTQADAIDKKEQRIESQIIKTNKTANQKSWPMPLLMLVAQFCGDAKSLANWFVVHHQQMSFAQSTITLKIDSMWKAWYIRDFVSAVRGASISSQNDGRWRQLYSSKRNELRHSSSAFASTWTFKQWMIDPHRQSISLSRRIDDIVFLDSTTMLLLHRHPRKDQRFAEGEISGHCFILHDCDGGLHDDGDQKVKSWIVQFESSTFHDERPKRRDIQMIQAEPVHKRLVRIMRVCEPELDFGFRDECQVFDFPLDFPLGCSDGINQTDQAESTELKEKPRIILRPRCQWTFNPFDVKSDIDDQRFNGVFYRNIEQISCHGDSLITFESAISRDDWQYQFAVLCMSSLANGNVQRFARFDGYDGRLAEPCSGREAALHVDWTNDRIYIAGRLSHLFIFRLSTFERLYVFTPRPHGFWYEVVSQREISVDARTKTVLIVEPQRRIFQVKMTNHPKKIMFASMSILTTSDKVDKKQTHRVVPFGGELVRLPFPERTSGLEIAKIGGNERFIACVLRGHSHEVLVFERVA